MDLWGGGPPSPPFAHVCCYCILTNDAHEMTLHSLFAFQLLFYFLGNKIKCPECREDTEIPSEGLPPNIGLQRIADILINSY